MMAFLSISLFLEPEQLSFVGYIHDECGPRQTFTWENKPSWQDNSGNTPYLRKL